MVRSANGQKERKTILTKKKTRSVQMRTLRRMLWLRPVMGKGIGRSTEEEKRSAVVKLDAAREVCRIECTWRDVKVL